MGKFVSGSMIVAMSAVLLALAGCDDADDTPTATTTSVTAKVIDGAIQGATVCMDLNGNGLCEPGEPQGTSDASGNVTLAVPNADVGLFPIVAIVGTNAIDAVNGAVTTPYVLTAPADKTAVISPLTTIVQQVVANTGVTSAAAEATLQSNTGITVSLFGDYTASTAATTTAAAGVSPAQVARLLVLFEQKQYAAVSSTVGTMASDGTTITQANITSAIQQAIQQQLPAIVQAVTSSAVQTAATPAAVETQLQAAATQVVASSGLTSASAATLVAINNQSTATTSAAFTPAAYSLMVALGYTDANNYYLRTLTSSLAQDTPDVNNNIVVIDHRRQAVAGSIATWGGGSSTTPARNADVHWSGSAWVNCPINYPNTSVVRNAQGFSSYNFCTETGTSIRATFDISGRTLSSVYNQIVTAGYTNVTLSNPTVLGTTATFPTGSTVGYQTTTALTEAIAYYPAGANNPGSTSNVVDNYSTAVSSGGTASSQAAGVGCNSTESSANAAIVTPTLEAMIAANTGTPCIYGQGTAVYNGVTYTSPSPTKAWWGQSTVSLGTLGSFPVDSGTTAPGYYSGNILLRVAFVGTGANPVTYYACQQEFVTGRNNRDCVSIGTGTYTIATLGDGRALTFNNLPTQTSPLNYNRVFVERGGNVYYGYQNKPYASLSARLNTVAATAFLSQLGIASDDPNQPLALTAGSYTGTWDVYSGTTAPGSSLTNFLTTAVLNSNGTSSCRNASGTSYACTLTITSAGTGAVTFADASSNSATGTFNFLLGTGQGTYNGSIPFLAYRR